MKTFPEHKCKISILIVSWNSKLHLENCLKSIFQSTFDVLFKVFVIDNHSQDGTAEMIQASFPNVTFHDTGANLGFAKANNIALQLINTPYILFLNPDTLVNDYVFDSMLKVFTFDSNIGGVGCKTYKPNGGLQILPIQNNTTLPYFFLKNFLFVPIFKMSLRSYFLIKDPQTSGYVNKLFCHCFMADSQTIKNINGFDEDYFMYMEDVDLSIRIKQYGKTLFYSAETSIIHLGGASSESLPSNFSSITLLESVNKYILKNFSTTGSIIYRISVLLSSSIKLAYLYFSKYILRRESSNGSVNGKIILNLHKVKWSLNPNQLENN